MDWELVRGDAKGLNGNEIIRPLCPISILNEELLLFVRKRVPLRTIVVRTGNKPWFDEQCVLAHREKQGAYRMWSRSKMQVNWEKYRETRRHAHHVYV